MSSNGEYLCTRLGLIDQVRAIRFITWNVFGNVAAATLPKYLLTTCFN
jgi:hypothetical protein